MKKITFLLIAFTSFSIFTFSQKLIFNEDKIYECDTVFNFQDSSLIETLKTRVISLNYDIEQGANSQIIAKKEYSLGAGASQKVKYRVRIDVKENKYKLTFSNFIIQYPNDNLLKVEPLEKMLFKKLWIKNINKELPRLVEELDLNKNASKENKDW